MALTATAAFIRSTGGWLLAQALPPRCPGCGTVTPEDHRFCVECWKKLDFIGEPCCATCGDPFEIDPGQGARCGPCLADPPAFDQARAAVAYGDISRGVALRLKYGRRAGMAETIARQLDRLIDAEGFILVPVPLHRWRIWSRGYNQSALIARAIARRRDLAVCLDLIERTRHTPVLRGLGRTARATAVRGAFAIAPKYRATVRGTRVMLIDDIYTTGATANACARLLKRAGADEVRLLCWARVVRDTDERAQRAIDN